MSGTTRSDLTTRKILPLISRSFAPGKCMETIEAIGDAEEREMAFAKHSMFTGNAEDAALRSERFLTHADPALCLSAHIVHCFSNVTLGRTDKAQKMMAELETLDVGSRVPISGAYCAEVVRVLFHLPEKDPTKLNEIPPALPEGCRFFLCYVLALREYLRGEYGKAEGIATAALTLNNNRYPISAIYLHIVSTISLMRRERLEEASRHFMDAWELALPVGLISPFGEHYVLLSGLNKKLINPEFYEKYCEISKYADRYFSNWITIHNRHTAQRVAPGLSKMESTVATLFSRGWNVKDVAQHLNVSHNTVKRHLFKTYQKLGVNKREQLRDYLLR